MSVNQCLESLNNFKITTYRTEKKCWNNLDTSDNSISQNHRFRLSDSFALLSGKNAILKILKNTEKGSKWLKLVKLKLVKLIKS